MCVSVCVPACEMRALIVGHLQLEAEAAAQALRAEVLLQLLFVHDLFCKRAWWSYICMHARAG